MMLVSNRRRTIILCLFCVISISDGYHSTGPSFSTNTLRIRGGSINGGSDSSAGDLEDDELDEYIDFLLAAAEEKVTEVENPLFKRFLRLAEEVVVVEEQEEENLEGDKNNEGIKSILLPLSTSKLVENTTLETLLLDSEKEDKWDNQESSVSEQEDISLSDENVMNLDPIVEQKLEELERHTEELIQTLGIVGDDLLFVTSDNENLLEPLQKQATVDIENTADDVLAEVLDEHCEVLDVATTNLAEVEIVQMASNEDETIPQDIKEGVVESNVPINKEITDAGLASAELLLPLDDQELDVEVPVKELMTLVEEKEEEILVEEQKESTLEGEPLTMVEVQDDHSPRDDTPSLLSVEDQEKEMEVSVEELVTLVEEKEVESLVEEQKECTLVEKPLTLVDELENYPLYETASLQDETLQIDKEEYRSGIQVKDDAMTNQVKESKREQQATPELGMTLDVLDALTSTQTDTQVISSNEQDLEFFLGPSAVDESPTLIEDSIVETNEINIVPINVNGELDAIDPTLVMEALKEVTSDDAATNTTRILNQSRKAWGKWTGFLLGIKTENIASSTTSKSYTAVWGKWTALLMGISTKQRISFGTSDEFARKRDIDRIYRKYFTDYVPDPTLYPDATQTAPVVESEIAKVSETKVEEADSLVASSLRRVSGLWGKIEQVLKFERSKPLAFISGVAQDGAVEDQSTDFEADGINVKNDILGRDDATLQVQPSEVSVVVEPLIVQLNAAAGETEDNVTSVDQVIEEVEEVKIAMSVTTEGERHVAAENESFDVLHIGQNCMIDTTTNKDEESLCDVDGEESYLCGDDQTLVDTRVETQPSEHAKSKEPLKQGNMSVLVNEASDTSSDRSLDDFTVITPDYYDEDNQYADYDDEDRPCISPPIHEIIEEEYQSYHDDDVVELQEDVDGNVEYESDDRDDSEAGDLDAQVESEEMKKKHPSRVLGIEPTHIFYNFLIIRGLEAWLMTIVLFVEWCRIYLSPFSEILQWLLLGDFKSSRLEKLRSTVLTRVRGGDEEMQPINGSTDDNEKVLQKDEIKSEATPNVEVVGGRIEQELQPRRSRPNAFYRYLFTYGRLGHVVIMECVLLQEWVELYLPAARNCFNWAIAQILPSVFGSKDRTDTAPSQTTGFVGADGSAVRGAKKRSSQMRKEDQKALNQLKKVGDISQARYRFLSQNFMKRHAIGPFADERTLDNVSTVLGETELHRPMISQKNDDDTAGELESDAEWIVSALTQDEFDVKKQFVRDNEVASPSATAVEFKVCGPIRKKRKRSAISDVTRLTSERAKKKANGPRLSDRESGVMGRIRAAGANSLVGRSILGAYPGDVPSPSDAANPRGLFDLAERYGYGDWSESDEDYSPQAEFQGLRLGRKDVDLKEDFKTSSERKKKRRRKTSRQVEFDFGIGIGRKSSFPSVPRTKARPMAHEEAPKALVTEKVRKAYKENPKTNNAGSVSMAGLGAFEKNVESRRKKHNVIKKDKGSDLLAKIQEAKSRSEQTGRSSVANAGIEYLKDKKAKATESDSSE